jgi:TIR domain/Trypsin-like peptidase domain
VRRKQEKVGHVFISYSHEDSDFAEVLISKIEKEGLSIWADSDRLNAGEDWRSTIDQAIKEAFVLIVVMSPSAKASEYVTYEWAFAWGAGVKAIPVLFKPTELHPRLESLQYLDFSNRSFRPWDKLIKLVKNEAEEYAYLAHAQQETLYELLPLCTVSISLSERHTGTGFFVAPKLVLTCSHVTQVENKSETQVHWNEQVYSARILKDFPVDGDYIDLTLLQIDLSDHPCVYLHDGAIPSDTLYTYGYSQTLPDGDAATFEFEGRGDRRGSRLKFKAGQVRAGMSGAPLLNIRTGGVCGIVETTFDQRNVSGGMGIPTKTIFQNFLELQELQLQFHQQNRRWISCLTPAQRRLIVLPKKG